MEPRFYLLLSASIALASVIITYYVTLNRIRSKEHEARIDATREKAVRETKEAMLAELHTERMISDRRSGWMVKKQWLVLNERLCLGDLPISGWVEHAVLVDQQVDEEKLKLLADSVSFFFVPGEGKVKVLSLAARKMVAKIK